MSEQENKIYDSKNVIHVGKSGVVCRKDLSCGEDKKFFYDIYECADHEQAEGKPAILYVYPDLFEKNPRKERQSFCMRLAGGGHKVIFAGYADNKKGDITAGNADFSAKSLIENLLKQGTLNGNRVIIFSDGSGALVAMEAVIRLLADAERKIEPIAVVALDGLYDLKRFAISDVKKRFKSKVLHSFTGGELRNGMIPEDIVPKIRGVNVLAHVKYGFPPLFWAHSICEEEYEGQGDLVRKTLITNGICGREYKAVYLRCRRYWEFGDGVAAKSLQISLREFFDSVEEGTIKGNEYIEI